MKLLQLPPAELRRQLASTGVWLRTGPFSFKVQSRIPAVAQALGKLYGQFEVRNPHEAFADFHVSVNPHARFRRWLRFQAAFSFDGVEPFTPLPRSQAFPLLEAGFDWCVTSQAQQYLILRAAVVEKHGLAAILPGQPGSGKSTLAAGLTLAGWRLLSDALALVDRKSGLIQPLPRPVGLKNGSIELIRQLDPEACFGFTTHNSAGTLAHLRPPRDSVQRQHEPARPGWVIFPRWQAGARTCLTARSPAQAFMQLVQGAYNYRPLGADSFHVASALVDQSSCYDFRYSRLDDAIATFDRLAESARPS